MQPVLPPYRVEIQGIGIGVDPPRFPVKTHRTTPGATGEICTPDEVAMWAYVEHLESQVRKLNAELGEVEANANAAPPAVTEEPPPSNPQPTGDAPVMGPPKKRKGKS